MKRCLVVDDSKIVRKVVRKIIESLGFEVVEAEDGKVAVEQLRAMPVDFMILDWNMPVMDGLECMKTLRADPNITQPKIIFCTTENDFSKIQTAIMSGADEYVMKPFDESIIAGKLRQLGILEDEA
jgi:two-component system chemotaxis response regulator CheY